MPDRVPAETVPAETVPAETATTGRLPRSPSSPAGQPPWPRPPAAPTRSGPAAVAMPRMLPHRRAERGGITPPAHRDFPTVAPTVHPPPVGWRSGGPTRSTLLVGRGRAPAG